MPAFTFLLRSAKKEFVKCGILRQLLGVLGGNTGKQYAVILKKVGVCCH